MTEQEIKDVLRSHKKWLAGDGGKIADLRGADLRGADFAGAELARAKLAGANFRGADLQRADLKEKWGHP